MKYFLLILSIPVLFSCKNEKQKTIQNTELEVKKEIVKKEVVNISEMVYFDGGKINIGANDRTPIESPAHQVNVKPFYLDVNLVTVADFRAFVKATRHTTEAEKFGDSGVYNFKTLNWELLKGATWEYPLGANKEKATDNHPVTHVSWNDARAYAAWIGKRLPTEEEWEFAAKNGGNLKYPWGDTLLPNNKYMANVWQGKSAAAQETFDGYLHTSPIGSFPKSKSGLYDMSGNVWQWTLSVFTPYDKNINFPKNPQIRVTKGGSFMFDTALELSYTTTFRAQNSVDTSLFNTGFRCAKSVE